MRKLMDALRDRLKIVGKGNEYSGRLYLPLNLVGKRVAYITEAELVKLEKEMRRLHTIRKFSNHVLNTKNGSRMFNIVSKTWNPITGCTHYCTYCWARRLALTKLKNTHKYREGFMPKFHENELKAKFSGGIVFVADMGDMFCSGVPDEWIKAVINHVRKYPSTFFLFLTKNPERYKNFVDDLPNNVILGATIETNRDEIYLEHTISRAPLPSLRYKAMRSIDWDLKFISIEPILDFDTDTFVDWIKEINPFMVYVGYDNYGNKLPEPKLEKTLELITKLSEITLVIKKTIRRAWHEKGSVLKYTTKTTA